MTFSIDNSMTVGDLKALFRKAFGTAVRVKNGKHLADDFTSLQSIGAISAEIDYDENTSVGDFEDEVLLHARLIIDISTPDDWEVALNEIPLSRVKHLPSGMTIEKMKRILVVDKDELEDVVPEEQAEPSVVEIASKKTAKGLPDDYIVSERAVEDYLAKWYTLSGYVEQEAALNKLFNDLCPASTDMNDVLLKISVLNDFYSTNIYDVYGVAKHYIHDIKDLDKRIKEADSSVVDELAAVPLRKGEKEIRHYYSFATKYCSHHNPSEYPIYDRYVRDVLMFFKKRDDFAHFVADDLKSYPKFKLIVAEFRDFYKLTKYNFKQVDSYLWQLGKNYYNPYK